MLLLKILFAFLTVGSVGLADYTGYNAWFALTGIAGIQWAKMEIFEIAYGATAAAIKDYETTGAEIEDAIEGKLDKAEESTILDSEVFRRRLSGDEDYQS